MQSFMDAGLSDDEFDVDDLAAGPSDAGAYAAGSAEHYPGGGPAHAGPSNVESIPAGDARASCAPAHDAAHGLAGGCAVARPIRAKIVAVAVRQSGPRTRSSWCNLLVTHPWKMRFERCFDWAVLTSALDCETGRCDAVASYASALLGRHAPLMRCVLGTLHARSLDNTQFACDVRVQPCRVCIIMFPATALRSRALLLVPLSGRRLEWDGSLE